MEHLDKLKLIADALVSGTPVNQFWGYKGESFHLRYNGIIVPKERARAAGKGGHHYTPKDTREFEAKVKQLAKERMQELKLTRFYRNCVVHLTITDAIPPDWPWWMQRLATSNMIADTRGGDLDNKEKAILDAFNKVVFDDDKLVVQVFKTRRYGENTGFYIDIAQVGLTKNDLENIGKLIGGRNAPQTTREN